MTHNEKELQGKKEGKEMEGVGNHVEKTGGNGTTHEGWRKGQT